MTVTITQLLSYPIKSCAAIEHQMTTLNQMGLKGDRQLMLVDENGLFLSQRKHPQMALIKPTWSEQGLVINAPGMEPMSIDLKQNTAKLLKVDIWNDSLQAESMQAHVNQWFSDYLNLPVRLVKYGQQSHRAIDPNYAQKGETVAFADGYPLLVTHQATIEQLNQQLEKPIDMNRFRPNIVVSGDLAAWDELNWKTLSDGSVQIDLVKPCTRCVMTGIEQTTGQQTGTEVLMTLKKKFAHNDKAVFGINGIARMHDSAELTVGQKLKPN